MRRVMTAAAALAVAGCMAEGGLSPREEASRRALAEAVPVGPPENCIRLSMIRHSVARDDRTIDFHMADRRTMRSRLPHHCPGLAFQDSFLYRTSLDRLCAAVTMTVLYPDGNRGPTCGLGPFQPVEIAPR